MQPCLQITVFNGGTNAYLEARNIVKKKDGYELAEAFPLKKETLNNIASLIIEKGDAVIFKDQPLPSNVLAFNNNIGHLFVVWTCASARRHLCFSKILDIPEGDVTVPGMVFVYRDGRMMAFAYRGRYSTRSKLCLAPFYNTYSDNSACLGNSRIDLSVDTVEAFLRSAESAYFDSKFTNEGRTDCTRSPMREVWIKAVKTGQFPQEELVETEIDLWKHLQEK